MSTFNYHYIIIGAGAAGLNLALAMNEDAFFKDKKILILDKDKKTKTTELGVFGKKGMASGITSFLKLGRNLSLLPKVKTSILI